MTTARLTAIFEREGSGYVGLCPQVDIASQGDTIEEATTNLREAAELYFEMADPEEIKQRLKSEVYVTLLEVAIAQTERFLGRSSMRVAPARRFCHGAPAWQPLRHAEGACGEVDYFASNAP